MAWVRRRGVGRALPKAHLQADLDIATLPGSSPSETLLADAEVIRAVSEVCPSQHLLEPLTDALLVFVVCLVADLSLGRCRRPSLSMVQYHAGHGCPA